MWSLVKHYYDAVVYLWYIFGFSFTNNKTIHFIQIQCCETNGVFHTPWADTQCHTWYHTLSRYNDIWWIQQNNFKKVINLYRISNYSRHGHVLLNVYVILNRPYFDSTEMSLNISWKSSDLELDDKKSRMASTRFCKLSISTSFIIDISLENFSLNVVDSMMTGNWTLRVEPDGFGQAETCMWQGLTIYCENSLTTERINTDRILIFKTKILQIQVLWRLMSR